MQRWNLTVQQLLPGRILFESGYAGSRGTQLHIGKNPDALPVSTSASFPIAIRLQSMH